MSKSEKLIKRLLSSPKDFSWDELVTILGYCGYSEIKKGKTGGSRRKFADADNNIISLHKPHPSNVIKGYALKEVVEHLKEKGKIRTDE